MTDNPASDFLRLFAVALVNLPGVLVFSRLNGKGVFFPFDTETIVTEPEKAERRLADLFVMIDRARKGSAGSEDVIENLGEGTDTVYTTINYAIDAGNSIQILRANAGSHGLGA